MKRLFTSIILASTTLYAIGKQDSTQTQWEGTYFKYTAHKSTLNNAEAISARPLFATPPQEYPGMIYAKVEYLNKDYSDRNWTGFTNQFIEQVLKKHLTIDEIRELMDKEKKTIKAHICFWFDYSGKMLYAYFLFKKEVNHIFTDEKLYGIYQDFMKMKVDTEGFLWWTTEGRPTLDEQKKIYNMLTLPFFFKHNCP